jgi:AraC-like DNA-binding protein
MNQTSNWPLPAAGRRLLTPGFILRELATHPLSSGLYPTAMGHYPAASGHVMQRSRPSDNLLIFCTEGSGQLTVGREAQRIGRGDLVLLVPGEAHAYRAAAQEPWTIYWTHFTGSDAAAFTAWLRSHGARPVLHCGVEPSLLGGFQQLLDSVAVGAGLDAYIGAANRLRQLITAFAAQRSRPTRDQRIGAIDLASLQLYMRERIATQLTLAELAALARLSPRHFVARYRERSGYPPLQHFLHMKMEAACRLLDSTDDSVKSIAGRLGYGDPLYFSRSFRRIVGLSPRDYRRSQRR